MEAHISRINGSAHFTTKCTRANTYIPTYDKWKRTCHKSMYEHLYKYKHTDICTRANTYIQCFLLLGRLPEPSPSLGRCKSIRFASGPSPQRRQDATIVIDQRFFISLCQYFSVERILQFCLFRFHLAWNQDFRCKSIWFVSARLPPVGPAARHNLHRPELLQFSVQISLCGANSSFLFLMLSVFLQTFRCKFIRFAEIYEL